MLGNTVKTNNNSNQKLPYDKPKVYHLGSMDKVQGGSRGSYPEPFGYYSG